MRQSKRSTRKGNTHLNVFIKLNKDEILVGTLLLENRLVYFKYDDDFLSLGLNLSPFKLKYTNEIQVANPTPFHGIFGVFDDSLPDGWGMLLLNRALEKDGLSLDDINILDQLAYIGDTGKGALIYRPAISINTQSSGTIDLDRLKGSIDQVYSGTSTDVIEELQTLGGSSGGARPKANIGYNSETDEIIYGQTPLPKGFSHWIIKFRCSEDPLDMANIEYAYSRMAVLAGIHMSECRLLKSKNGTQVFATKRFDRDGNDRVHMHSMAGLTHDNFRLSAIDYGHIIHTAYQLERSALAREKILRLASFNVYSHNRDDHSKNFSWLMDASGNWTFAPAYDLTYSSTSIDEHITRVAGEGAHPRRSHLIALANEFSIKDPDAIIDAVQTAIRKWPVIARQCGVSKTSLDRIHSRLMEIRD